MPPAANADHVKINSPTPRPPISVANTAEKSDPPAPAGRVTELRVSANLMNLEAGVYCVFPMPDSPEPDRISGLPGVRITKCPGLAGRPEAVSISTFRDDGWLDNAAALVRVTNGPAQVLVTIYQEAGRPSEKAPRLQVLRLTGESGGSAQTDGEMATSPDAAPLIVAHIQGVGDVPGGFGDWIGERGSRAWVEGFSLSDSGSIPPGQMEYQAILGKGWTSPWVEIGKFCGSRGMALPLLGLNIRLKGAAAKNWMVRYEATFVDDTAVGPVNEGMPCETPGLAALEAFRVDLIARTGRSGRSPVQHAPGRQTAPGHKRRAGRA